MSQLIYNRVMKLIDEQRLTRHQVEVAAGLGNNTIESWRNGNPTIGNLEKVANVLGTTVEALVRRED